MNNLLSLEETKALLEVEEQEFNRLLHKGKLQAYKLGGTYLRFRREEVFTLKQELYPSKKKSLSIPWFARLGDFWRFNNFYILSLLLIGILFLVVLRFS